MENAEKALRGTRSKGWRKGLPLLAICLYFVVDFLRPSLTKSAEVIYDCVGTNEQRIVTFGNAEYGDQVFIAGGEWEVTSISFGYFVSTNASGNEKGELSIYANDASAIGAVPGTVLYSSGAIRLLRGPNEVQIPIPSVVVSRTFTWAIRFTGCELDEKIGLYLSDPPHVGTSLDDFWLRVGGEWKTHLIDEGRIPANFSVRILAIPTNATTGSH